MDDEVRYLHQLITLERLEFEKRIKPYLDRLAFIESLSTVIRIPPVTRDNPLYKQLQEIVRDHPID